MKSTKHTENIIPFIEIIPENRKKKILLKYFMRQMMSYYHNHKNTRKIGVQSHKYIKKKTNAESPQQVFQSKKNISCNLQYQ